MTPEAFSNAVLAWYDQHGRKDLPWQHDISPYRVWVSEIMLQQTQVSTVLGYFDRFMHALPDVHALAAASEDQVLHLWTGLGYYSRARNLHKTAQQVVTQFGGEFPASVEQLCTLPGIGRSTAGAIASLSMGITAPILDGNVKRVLARFLAQTGWPGDSATSKALWAAAERYTPNLRGHHYTQAMMDLGATLCTRSKPQCLLCPLASHCQARLLGTPTAFPESKPRKVLPQKQVVMPLFAHNGHVLLYKRPSQGLWGGLWSLPELDQTDAIATQAAQLQLSTGEQQALPSLKHTFSHFQLQISPVLIHCQASPSVAEGDWLWYNLSAPPTLGLAAPVQKLLQQAAEHLTRC